jgi:hypothetical protein
LRAFSPTSKTPQRDAMSQDDGWYRRLRGPAALVILLTLAPEPAQGRRPLDTEDTAPVAAGSGELELSGDYFHLDGSDRAFAVAVFNLGLVPRLDVGLQLAGALYDAEGEALRGGLGDGLLTFKWLLLDETEVRPAILFSPAARLPMGSTERKLGLPQTDIQLLLVGSKTFGPLTIDGNGARMLVTWDRSLDHWRVSASASYALTATWTPVAEAVATVGARGAPDSLLLRAGAIFRATEGLHLDAAAAVGVTGNAPDVTVTAGLTLAVF